MLVFLCSSHMYVVSGTILYFSADLNMRLVRTMPMSIMLQNLPIMHMLFGIPKFFAYYDINYADNFCRLWSRKSITS